MKGLVSIEASPLNPLLQTTVHIRKTSIMEVVYAILIGLVVGIVAKLLMPGRDPGGFIITTLLGIAGAIVARYLGQAMGWYGPGEPVGIIASVAGAIILLLLYRLLFGRRART